MIDCIPQLDLCFSSDGPRQCARYSTPEILRLAYLQAAPGGSDQMKSQQAGANSMPKLDHDTLLLLMEMYSCCIGSPKLGRVA